MRGKGSDVAFTTLARLYKFGPDHRRDCGIYAIIPVHPVSCAVAVTRRRMNKYIVNGGGSSERRRLQQINTHGNASMGNITSPLCTGFP